MYYLMDLERTVRLGIPHYWKRNQHGYTPVITSAGLFSKEEAEEVVKNDLEHRTMMIAENVIKGITK